ncbi:MAG: OmpA family protein [Cytophagales bacterium]|nr:OmpA family protein [Cytophaga sp.]
MKLFSLSLILFFAAPSFAQQQVRWSCKLDETNETYKEYLYSAQRVTGVPDAYPAYPATENGFCWIPGFSPEGYLEKDTYVKVSFCDPIIARQVVIIENFNPGSVTSVTITEQSGKIQVVYKAKAADQNVPSRVLSIPFKQTATPVISVLVTTSAGKVKGRNYIDAIGIASTADPVNLKINLSKDAALMGTSTPLSNNINTPNDETYPIVSSDGNILYFARVGDEHNIENPEKIDIWYATKTPEGNWNKAENIGKPLNNKAHNFVSSLTPDVNTLLLGNTYNADGSPQGPGVSISHHTAEGWEIPATVNIEAFKNRNTFASYFLAADGKTMLLGIEMEDSFGDSDLYVSFLKKDGTWTKPMNLGTQINTFQMEASPFLAADGKTLYFTSAGYLGYGLYDIFMIKRLDDTWKNWTEPVNLGPGINTASGESGFSIPASGEIAYTYRYRNSNYHSDIYSVVLPPSLKPEPVTIISGRVLDAKTRKPVGANITYNLLPTGINAGIATSDPSTGSYKIVLNNNGNTYGYSAGVPGYFSVHESITIDSKTLYNELKVDLLLVPIEKGQNMVLQNVFFYQSKPELLPSSYPELDRLMDVLAANPTVRIELDGHTDNQGDPVLNVELSQKRVNTVRDYLISKGINPKQITTKAFGGSKPIAPNDAEEHRKKNRRVEITVLDF